jgi:putative nucleotidyltransferase with HDIG domain
MELFLKLQPNEQAHSLHIYRQLRNQNSVDDDLLVAALLHDVGKAYYPLRPWERAWIVLAKAVSPARVAQWGRAEPRGWKRPFVIAEQHAAWGAEMAARAGASPTAVNLIRRHQQPISPPALKGFAPASREDQLLYRLQLLDNES